MSEMGKAMMGTGEASGEGRAVAAAEAAIANPLIDDVSLKGAKGLIINITGGKDITLYEVDEAANRIKQEVDEEANIIYGTTCDDRLDGLVRVSIVATGIDSNVGISAKPLESFAPININNEVYKPQSNLDENVDALNIGADLDHNQGVIHSEITNTQETKIAEDEHQLETLEETSTDVEQESTLSESSIEESDNIADHIEEEVSNQYENIDNENTNTNELAERVENIEGDQINEENSNETSVRRLSLFDNISTDATSDAVDQKKKSEPMISEHIHEADENENSHTPAEVEERVEPEFNATSDESDDDFNQETEEELLDIPTFLRRQAN
jgi:cell division protein FtsZ